MELRDHDHELVLLGVVEGITSWRLDCAHWDTTLKWYVDDVGTEWDECLLIAWFEECGTDLIAAMDGDTPIPTPIHLWTHWNLDHTPQLLGRSLAERFLDVEGEQP
jgi:hypothetical protein